MFYKSRLCISCIINKHSLLSRSIQQVYHRSVNAFCTPPDDKKGEPGGSNEKDKINVSTSSKLKNILHGSSFSTSPDDENALNNFNLSANSRILNPELKLYDVEDEAASESLEGSEVSYISDVLETEGNPPVAYTGGFARALDKFDHLELEPKKQIKKQEKREIQSFATLLRRSKFIQLGDPRGKIVIGTIFHTVNTDLYIDFGGKFYVVCPRPVRNSRFYTRGATVRLRLLDLEMATRFLGSITDMTLLEADAKILGLEYSPLHAAIRAAGNETLGQISP